MFRSIKLGKDMFSDGFRLKVEGVPALMVLGNMFHHQN